METGNNFNRFARNLDSLLCYISFHSISPISIVKYLFNISYSNRKIIQYEIKLILFVFYLFWIHSHDSTSESMGLLQRRALRDSKM